MVTLQWPLFHAVADRRNVEVRLALLHELGGECCRVGTLNFESVTLFCVTLFLYTKQPTPSTFCTVVLNVHWLYTWLYTYYISCNVCLFFVS